MAKDRYGGTPVGMDGPLIGGFAITPQDSDLPQVTRSIWVGAGGTVWLVMQTGETVDIPDVPSGTWLHVRAHQVLPATTAQKLRGFY